jgi:hypothetical protein
MSLSKGNAAIAASKESQPGVLPRPAPTGSGFSQTINSKRGICSNSSAAIARAPFSHDARTITTVQSGSVCIPRRRAVARTMFNTDAIDRSSFGRC